MRMTPALQKRALRTNTRLMWAFAVLFAIPMVAFLALGVFLEDDRATMLSFSIPYAAIIAFMVVYTYAWIPRRLRQLAVAYGDGTYTFTEWFRTTTLTPSDVARVATVQHMAAGNAPVTHHLILAGHTRRLIHLVGYMWEIEQLRALAADLGGRGIPIVNLPQPITLPQLRHIDVRFVPWWQAHAALLALLLGLGAAVFLVGILAVVVLVVV